MQFDCITYRFLLMKETILFLGLWEQLHTPDFKRVEFDAFKSEVIPVCVNKKSQAGRL